MAERLKRLGIFGGTYNPPHIGHIHAAVGFFREMKLDELIIMPASTPPHKVMAKTDDPMLRLEMCHAAFDGLSDKITVSDYEIKKGGISYTVETLEHYSEPGTKLFFLCGADQFVTLDTWNMPQKIFDDATFVCAIRGDDGIDTDRVGAYAEFLRGKYHAEVCLLPPDPMAMSSTQVRNAVKAGDSIAEMVPEAVSRIITERGLYI